jgi:thiosulfate dehydrogenase (quinone) large subunit
MRYGYELLRDGPYLRVLLSDVLPPDWNTLRREVDAEIEEGASRVVMIATDCAGFGSDGAQLEDMVASLRGEGLDTLVVWDEGPPTSIFTPGTSGPPDAGPQTRVPDEAGAQAVVRQEEVGSMRTSLNEGAVREDRLPVMVPDADPEPGRRLGIVWGVLRLLMGWTFLWAFVDKLFGLGFATGRDVETGAIVFGGPDAWINGGSPTAGVLGFAVKGPFKGFYQSITGFQMGAAGPTSPAWVDWVFMLSMLAIGLALILGIGVKLASIGGAIWMVIFFTATAIWPEHNPFVDEHVIEFVVLVGLFLANAGRHLGFGRWWERMALVRKHPILA